MPVTFPALEHSMASKPDLLSLQITCTVTWRSCTPHSSGSHDHKAPSHACSPTQASVLQPEGGRPGSSDTSYLIPACAWVHNQIVLALMHSPHILAPSCFTNNEALQPNPTHSPHSLASGVAHRTKHRSQETRVFTDRDRTREPRPASTRTTATRRVAP